MSSAFEGLPKTPNLKLNKPGYDNVADIEALNENADICIVNTCTVTNTADNKSKQVINNIRKNNPEAIVVACGCFCEFRQDNIDNLINAEIIIGNKNKSKITKYIKEYERTHERIIEFYDMSEVDFEDMEIKKYEHHHRAFIKIEDGCNNFCSYCIIPYVRGSIRSKSFDDCLLEARSLVANGHKEIVLTGIHTGSYGTGTNHDLTDLIHEMSKIKGLLRIRISSIEITELNDKFLKELKENTKICNHLHIPLQAGSDEILKLMRRKYTLSEFKEKIKEIRSIRPNISISTDVIVGHPFETEELFLTTLETVKEIKFSKVHVFPYSKREGTLAARMDMQIPKSEKARRSHLLGELSLSLEQDYNKKFIGCILSVLIELDNTGLSSEHIKVHVDEDIPNNTLVKVLVTDVTLDGVIGHVQKF